MRGECIFSDSINETHRATLQKAYKFKKNFEKYQHQTSRKVCKRFATICAEMMVCKKKKKKKKRTEGKRCYVRCSPVFTWGRAENVFECHWNKVPDLLVEVQLPFSSHTSSWQHLRENCLRKLLNLDLENVGVTPLAVN